MENILSRRRKVTCVFTAIMAFVTLVGFLISGAYGTSMELYERKVISGNLEDVWHVATDVDRWPEWDPHEEAGEIYGPFEEGTHAYSKPRGGPAANWVLTEVTENRSWSLLNKMRIGTLKVENRYTPEPDGQVLCEKTMQVSGWILVSLFKLHFETVTRRDMQETWVALENRVASRKDAGDRSFSQATAN